MTAERAHAYGRVATLLRELGPAKLTDAEQQRIRDAADELIFSRGLVMDGRAQEAVRDVEALGHHLVATDRWSARRATALVDAVRACGPSDAVPVSKAA
jgi:hypothetical protein